MSESNKPVRYWFEHEKRNSILTSKYVLFCLLHNQHRLFLTRKFNKGPWIKNSECFAIHLSNWQRGAKSEQCESSWLAISNTNKKLSQIYAFSQSWKSFLNTAIYTLNTNITVYLSFIISLVWCCLLFSFLRVLKFIN